MKRVLFALMIMIQGVLVSQEISYMNVDGVDIPLVFEKDITLPLATLQLVVKNAGSMEDGDKDGIAKFLAAMLGEGTKEMNSTDFAEA